MSVSLAAPLNSAARQRQGWPLGSAGIAAIRSGSASTTSNDVAAQLLREALASGIAVSFHLIPLPDGSLRVDLDGRQQADQAAPRKPMDLAGRNPDLLTDDQARIFCGYEAKGIKSWQRYKKRRRIKKIGGGQFDLRDLKAALDSERAGR